MEPEFLEAGIDFERANAARIYDYLLGGAHNFAVDRDQAARVAAHYPHAAHAARANRAFLGRAVRWCLEQGITQFLDLGSGVPTVGNVHEIAHAHHPGARVAYVDFEPVAVAHAAELLAGLDTVTITRADLRDPASVLTAAGVAGLLDFTRPVAVLAVAVLHYIDRDLTALLGHYRGVLAPGSAIAVSHTSDDHETPETAAYARGARDGLAGSATEMTLRTRAELLELAAGLELVAPGLVDITDWPEPSADPDTSMYALVARVPDPQPPTGPIAPGAT